MGAFVVEMTIILDNIVDWLVEQINTLLNINPKEWAESMNIWDNITMMYDNVLPVASALLVLFFLIGFCENTIDVKEEMEFKTVLFLFMQRPKRTRSLPMTHLSAHTKMSQMPSSAE